MKAMKIVSRNLVILFCASLTFDVTKSQAELCIKLGLNPQNGTAGARTSTISTEMRPFQDAQQFIQDLQNKVGEAIASLDQVSQSYGFDLTPAIETIDAYVQKEKTEGRTLNSLDLNRFLDEGSFPAFVKSSSLEISLHLLSVIDTYVTSSWAVRAVLYSALAKHLSNSESDQPVAAKEIDGYLETISKVNKKLFQPLTRRKPKSQAPATDETGGRRRQDARPSALINQTPIEAGSVASDSSPPAGEAEFPTGKGDSAHERRFQQASESDAHFVGQSFQFQLLIKQREFKSALITLMTFHFVQSFINAAKRDLAYLIQLNPFADFGSYIVPKEQILPQFDKLSPNRFPIINKMDRALMRAEFIQFAIANKPGSLTVDEFWVRWLEKEIPDIRRRYSEIEELKAKIKSQSDGQ